MKIVLCADANFTYLPFIPLGVEYGSIVTTLPEGDDVESGAIVPPIAFPFSDSLQTQFFVSSCIPLAFQTLHACPFQVGSNGIISFDSEYNPYNNNPFPVENLYLVAPFWDDADTREGNGDISYQEYGSGYFLEHVSSFVRKQSPSTFHGTWMSVVYWDAVHPFRATDHIEVGKDIKLILLITKMQENTYQAILITDGTQSYAVFIYKCGLLEWGDGATIGFNAPGGFYHNHEISHPGVDCVNYPISNWNNVVYLLSHVTPEVEMSKLAYATYGTSKCSVMLLIKGNVTYTQ